MKKIGEKEVGGAFCKFGHFPLSGNYLKKNLELEFHNLMNRLVVMRK